MRIIYDSWNEKYKKPFGAVQKNDETRWSLEIDTDIHDAILWLTKNGETPVAYRMEYDQNVQLYQTKVRITTSGLYFYYFEINKDGQSYYLLQDKFGLGRITQSKDDINQFQITCFDRQVPSYKWYQEGIVYQIFPDRFCNGLDHDEVLGRKHNSFIYATQEDLPCYVKDEKGNIIRWDFFGGNFAGIIKKIPYLKKLGITIIYLNPIFLSPSNHRYDTSDFMKIEPMLGDEAEFQKLVNELHKNGIHLILDGVFNHVGKDSIYFQAAIKNSQSPYCKWFNFIKYPSDYQSWWGIKSLPEVNKNNPDYQDFIYGDHGVLAKWTGMNVDGWRLDVADELPMDFLRNIRQRLEKENCDLVIGEVWEDASKKFVNGQFRPYMAGDNLTGTMNYPMRNFIVDVLTADNNNVALSAENSIAQLIENYPSEFLRNCLNNIGTHDTERIKTVLNNNEQLVAIAFGLLFMMPGVPCVYYGDEAGLEGHKDPDNRRNFPWHHASLYLEDQVTKFINIRKHHQLLIDGKIGFIHVNENVNGIIRYNDSEFGIFIFNKGPADYQIDQNKIEVYCVNHILTEKIKTAIDRKILKNASYIICWG